MGQGKSDDDEKLNSIMSARFGSTVNLQVIVISYVYCINIFIKLESDYS
jgi:hypothetical protein